MAIAPNQDKGKDNRAKDVGDSGGVKNSGVMCDRVVRNE